MSDLPQFPDDDATASDEDRMRALVGFLSSYIEHYHGGWVKMNSFDGETLSVEMGGACVGCPLSQQTLRGWVAGTARQFFPGLKRVEATFADS